MRNSSEKLTLLTRQLAVLEPTQQRDVATRLRALTDMADEQDGDSFLTTHILNLMIGYLESAEQPRGEDNA